jgi:GNAT superfamily N-acetyltransferase
MDAHAQHPRPRPLIRGLGEPGDLGWVVMAHGELYAQEYEWNGDLETLTCEIAGGWARRADRVREAAWIAELEGARVGCVFCVADPDEQQMALLRILLVAPAARRLGLGGALIDRAIDFARGAGYARMRLWTNQPLEDAARLYRARGFVLVASEPHASFGVELVGQIYEMTL